MSTIKEKVGNFTKEHAGDIGIIGITAVGVALVNLNYKKYCIQRCEDYNKWINQLNDLYTRKFEELTSKEGLDNFIEADKEDTRYATEEIKK